MRQQPSRIPPFVSKYRYFLLFVVLPTLIAATYLFLFAADQYESEAHFYVVGGSSSSGSGGGGGSSSSSGSGSSALLNGGGASSVAQEQTLAVLDFLYSHDAVRDLKKSVDLPASGG